MSLRPERERDSLKEVEDHICLQPASSPAGGAQASAVVMARSRAGKSEEDARYSGDSDHARALPDAPSAAKHTPEEPGVKTGASAESRTLLLPTLVAAEHVRCFFVDESSKKRDKYLSCMSSAFILS